MSHKDKQSLHQQVYDRLQSMNGFGRSKHEDKKQGITNKYIYSFSTMKTYMKHCNYYVKWCKNNQEIKNTLGHKPRTLDECEPYVEQYIRAREAQGCSAYTVKMELSAISKLYQKNYDDIKTIATSRANIKRSRGHAKRDERFNEEAHAELVNCCRCVGFRRMELEKCKSSDLWMKGGQYYVHIVGKGGKPRDAHVLGTPDEVRRAVEFIDKLNGHNYVNDSADIHSYRADYATRTYNANKKDISELKSEKINYTELTGKRNRDGSDIYKPAIYYCRGDKAGVAYDRRAMIIASQNLGHNRESVVGEHYLRI